MLIVYNFTPVTQFHCRVGAPRIDYWKEILNSDAKDYGVSGQENMVDVEAASVPLYNQLYSLAINLPPLAVVIFKSEEK